MTGTSRPGKDSSSVHILWISTWIWTRGFCLQCKKRVCGSLLGQLPWPDHKQRGLVADGPSSFSPLPPSHVLFLALGSKASHARQYREGPSSGRQTFRAAVFLLEVQLGCSYNTVFDSELPLVTTRRERNSVRYAAQTSRQIRS